MTKNTGKKGETYGVNLTLKRDLTPEESEHLSKVLDVTESALRLFLKDDIAQNKPQKPPVAPKK
jgi:uncharacterized protein (DUF2384 family)